MAGYAYSDEYDDIDDDFDDIYAEDDRYDLGLLDDEHEADDERLDELEAMLREKQRAASAARAVEPVPDIEADLCGNCHEKPPKSRKLGLCDTCYRYEKRTGKPRPIEVIERARTPRLRDDPLTAAYIDRTILQIADAEDRYVGDDERRRPYAEAMFYPEWRAFYIEGKDPPYARRPSKEVLAYRSQVADDLGVETDEDGKPIKPPKKSVAPTYGLKLTAAQRRELYSPYKDDPELPPVYVRSQMREQYEAFTQAVLRGLKKERNRRAALRASVPAHRALQPSPGP
jgi:hypothetical protein